MTRMTLKARVDPDGVLRVTVPMGLEEADRAVRLTVEPASHVTTRAEWSAWVDSMAGVWQGDFERPPQGTLEERDSL